jgi:predicted DNA-binding WGR domain protein
MRRFEFDDGESRKFRAVEARGAAPEIHFGRLQTAGRPVFKEFTTPALAIVNRHPIPRRPFPAA